MEKRNIERREDGEGEKHKQDGERLRLDEAVKTSRYGIGEKHSRMVMPILFLVVVSKVIYYPW